MDKIKEIIVAITSAFFSFFGLLAIPLLLLVASNIIDWITGIWASENRNEKVTSYKSFKGIKKKVSMYLLIFIGFMVDILMQYSISNLGLSFVFPNIISCIVAVWLICNEMLSILENLIDIGVKLPPFLEPLIKKIKAETENKIEIKEEKEDE